MNDQRLGREFGVTGTYAEIPVSQLFERAQDRFSKVRSRFVDLKFSANDRRARRSSQWRRINARMADLSLVANSLDGDAMLAAAFAEGVAELGRAIDGLAIHQRES